ncbi:MAG: hypothetical protein ABIR33_14480 [Pyrinomonadaceae bacterium]
MGLLDDVSDKLDALSAGQETSQSKAEEVKFVAGETLSKPESGSAGFVGTQPAGEDAKPNVVDAGIPTEYIHFGIVHPDMGKQFPHITYAPANETDAPDGHAISFRDGIEREAIVLFGFVSSTKQALVDATASRGGVDDLVNMASNALGGGGGSAPDPTQLDTFISEIKTIVGTVNASAVKYPDIHEAGKKLHETRANYAAACQAFNDYYIKPPEGGLMDGAAGALANLPGVGNIMAMVQRFGFKFFDLYLAAYLELRKTHEASVELGAHDLTIKAIKAEYKDFTFTYPIWFLKPDSQKPKKDEGGDDNLLKPITDKVEEVKKDVEEKIDDVYGFLGANSSPKKTPGTEALKAIFGKLKGPEETTPDAIPSASTCMVNGMDAAMQDIKGIPPFVKNVMAKMNDANIGLLEEIYGRMMAAGCEGEIKSSDLVMAGRRSLAVKIVGIMGDLVSGVLPSGDLAVNVPGGKTLSAQQFIAKIVEEKLMPYVDPVIEYMIGDLAGQMEASRKKAADEKAQTMEVMFGRLPWFTAIMFKNTFFPIWNLVIEKVFDEINPQIADVVRSVNSVFETAKNAVDTVQDYKARAGHVSDKMGSGVSSLQDLSDLKDAAADESPEAKARREEREKAQAEKDKLDKFYEPNDKDAEFPVTARVEDCEGIKVSEEIPSVLPAPPAPAGEPQADQAATA